MQGLSYKSLLQRCELTGLTVNSLFFKASEDLCSALRAHYTFSVNRTPTIGLDESIMEVVSTSRRGPHTIYTVREGDREFTLTRDQLPENVFLRWRRYQAALCMRKKRERSRQEQDPQQQPEGQPQPAHSNQPELLPVNQVNTTEPIDLSQPSSAVRKEDKEIQVDLDDRARNLVLCKVCKDAQVQKLIWPCGHLILCDNCLKQWLSQSKQCPLCRVQIEDHFGIFMVE